jgi:hypothetical protein
MLAAQWARRPCGSVLRGTARPPTARYPMFASERPARTRSDLLLWKLWRAHAFADELPGRMLGDGRPLGVVQALSKQLLTRRRRAVTVVSRRAPEPPLRLLLGWIRSEAPAPPCRPRALTPVVDYVREHTGGQRFDLIYSTVGGAVLDASFQAVRRFRRVVSGLGWD